MRQTPQLVLLSLKYNHMITALPKHLGIKPSLLSFAFILSVVVASSQEQKGLKQDIITKNGDTVSNGKKLSEGNKVEQEKLRKELHSLEISRGTEKGEGPIKRKEIGGKNSNAQDVIKSHDLLIPGIDEKEMKVMEFKFKDPMVDKRFSKLEGDSLLTNDRPLGDVKIRLEGPIRFENRMVFGEGERWLEQPPLLQGAPSDLLVDRNAIKISRYPKNSQSFNYSNVDKDGILTNVSFHVLNVEEAQIKKISGGAPINQMDNVKDLTLFPNFTTGKTTLSFQLPAKGSARVEVLNSNLQVLYADKTSTQDVSKQLLMPINGIYYVTIVQNKNWFIRKIVKE